MASQIQYGQDFADAIFERDEDKAETMLKQKVDLSYAVKGDMPIHLATRYGLKRTVKNLLKYGDDVNRPNQHENRPVHFAARDGMEDLLSFLISKGADVNIQNLDGDTPLHQAVANQSMDVIERYVALGMKINKQNQQGETPLHKAAVYGRDESVEALLLSGADADIKTTGGRLAHDMAKTAEIRELIRGFKLLSPFMESGLIRSQGMKLGHKDVNVPRLIERVDLTVEKIDLPSDFPTTFYFRREFSENSTVTITREFEDEIASDIYHIRVKDGYRDLTTRVTIPIYRRATDKETMCLRNLNGEGKRQLVTDVFEKGSILYCSFDAVLIPETTAALVIFIFPKAEEAVIGSEAQVLSSEVSPEFELNIPEGSFPDNTTINLKVFDAITTPADNQPSETNDSDDEDLIDSDDENGGIPGGGSQTTKTHGTDGGLDTIKERSEDDNDVETNKDNTNKDVPNVDDVSRTGTESTGNNNYKNLLSDVYEIVIVGEQPSKEITLQMPLQEISANIDSENMSIVRVNTDEPCKAGELPIEVLSTSQPVVDNNVHFDVEHFCILAIVRRITTDDCLAKSYEEIMNSRHRKKDARFFVVVKENLEFRGTYQMIVECGKADSTKKRRKRWEEKGFQKQRPKHSSKLLLTPSQDFRVSMMGDLQFDTDLGETGSRKLTYYTSRTSYQPYQVCLTPSAKKGKAYVLIHTDNIGADGGVRGKTQVAKLKVKVRIPRGPRRSSVPEAPVNVPKRPESSREVELYSKGESYPSDLLKM